MNNKPDDQGSTNGGPPAPPDPPERSALNTDRLGSAWTDSYEGMNVDCLPIYGVRLLVSLDGDSNQRVKWCFDNANGVSGFELSGLLHALADEVVAEYMGGRVERYDD